MPSSAVKNTANKKKPQPIGAAANEASLQQGEAVVDGGDASSAKPDSPPPTPPPFSKLRSATSKKKIIREDEEGAEDNGSSNKQQKGSLSQQKDSSSSSSLKKEEEGDRGATRSIDDTLVVAAAGSSDAGTGRQPSPSSTKEADVAAIVESMVSSAVDASIGGGRTTESSTNAKKKSTTTTPNIPNSNAAAAPSALPNTKAAAAATVPVPSGGVVNNYGGTSGIDGGAVAVYRAFPAGVRFVAGDGKKGGLRFPQFATCPIVQHTTMPNKHLIIEARPSVIPQYADANVAAHFPNARRRLEQYIRQPLPYAPGAMREQLALSGTAAITPAYLARERFAVDMSDAAVQKRRNHHLNRAVSSDGTSFSGCPYPSALAVAAHAKASSVSFLGEMSAPSSENSSFASAVSDSAPIRLLRRASYQVAKAVDGVRRDVFNTNRADKADLEVNPQHRFSEPQHWRRLFVGAIEKQRMLNAAVLRRKWLRSSKKVRPIGLHGKTTRGQNNNVNIHAGVCARHGSSRGFSSIHHRSAALMELRHHHNDGKSHHCETADDVMTMDATIAAMSNLPFTAVHDFGIGSLDDGICASFPLSSASSNSSSSSQNGGGRSADDARIQRSNGTMANFASAAAAGGGIATEGQDKKMMKNPHEHCDGIISTDMCDAAVLVAFGSCYGKGIGADDLAHYHNVVWPIRVEEGRKGTAGCLVGGGGGGGASTLRRSATNGSFRSNTSSGSAFSAADADGNSRADAGSNSAPSSTTTTTTTSTRVRDFIGRFFTNIGEQQVYGFGGADPAAGLSISEFYHEDAERRRNQIEVRQLSADARRNSMQLDRQLKLESNNVDRQIKVEEAKLTRHNLSRFSRPSGGGLVGPIAVLESFQNVSSPSATSASEASDATAAARNTTANVSSRQHQRRPNTEEENKALAAMIAAKKADMSDKTAHDDRPIRAARE